MNIFLSSTYKDLVEHRKLAIEAIERLGLHGRRMEIFGARPEEPSKACLTDIEACELFVGIYAHRYGYIPKGADLSVTEIEYRHAKELNKPLFCFIVDDDHPWPPKLIEDNPGKEKLIKFKKSIDQDLVREKFTTPTDLAFKIASSIGHFIYQDRMGKPGMREQAAAICYRINNEIVEFYLVKTTGNRWTFPKGNIKKGEEVWYAAQREADEESGATGIIEKIPITSYIHEKREWKDSGEEIMVHAFLLQVRNTKNPKELKEKKRQPAWYNAAEAEKKLVYNRKFKYAEEFRRVLNIVGDHISDH